MAKTEKVRVLVLKEFYDLKAREVLIRKVDDEYECTKQRAEYLIERGYVRLMD